MPSSLIGVLQRPCEDIDSACPDPQQFTALAEVPGRMPDPRRVRVRRYRLGFLLALCLVTVLGGAGGCRRLSAWLTSEENRHVTGQVTFSDSAADAVLRGSRVFD